MWSGSAVCQGNTMSSWDELGAGSSTMSQATLYLLASASIALLACQSWSEVDRAMEYARRDDKHYRRTMLLHVHLHHTTRDQRAPI